MADRQTCPDHKLSALFHFIDVLSRLVLQTVYIEFCRLYILNMSFWTPFATSLKALCMTWFLCQAAKAELAARGAGQVFVDLWICCRCLNDFWHGQWMAMTQNDDVMAWGFWTLCTVRSLFRSPWPTDFLISSLAFSSLPRQRSRGDKLQSSQLCSQNWKVQTNSCCTSEELGFVELKLTTARGLQGSKLGGYRSEIQPRCVWECECVCVCVCVCGLY